MEEGQDIPKSVILAQSWQYAGNLPKTASQSVPLGLNLTY